MAGYKVEQLPTASALAGTAYVYLVDGDGNSRKVALSDLAQWIITEESIVPASEPLVGARAVRTSTLAVNSGANPINWNAVDFDTDNFWSAGAPSRFTIPVGVDKVVLTGGLRIEGGSAVNSALWILMNGTDVCGGVSAATGYSNHYHSVATGLLEVSSGDYLELYLELSSVTSKVIQNVPASFFSIHAVEVQP